MAKVVGRGRRRGGGGEPGDRDQGEGRGMERAWGVDGKRRADAVVRGEGGDAAGDSRQWFARVRGRADLTSLASSSLKGLFLDECCFKTPIKQVETIATNIDQPERASIR